MTADEFNKILTQRIEKIRSVLESKATDYASTTDRLHNFKRAASITGETRFQVCVGFMVKHLVSVLDIVDKRSKGIHIPPETLDEKIGDSINYLILLEALILEKDAQ